MGVPQELFLDIDHHYDEPGVTTLPDTAQAIKEAERILADLLALTDQRFAELGKTLIDPTQLVDARTFALHKTLTDVLRELTDAVIAVKELALFFLEIVALTDRRQSALGKHLGDLALTTDARAFALQKAITDTVLLGDAVWSGGVRTRLLAEALVLRDARMAVLEKMLASICPIADGVGILLGVEIAGLVIQRVLADHLAVVDALVDVHWSQYRNFPGVPSRKVLE